jgi:hypothetical protein
VPPSRDDGSVYRYGRPHAGEPLGTAAWDRAAAHGPDVISSVDTPYRDLSRYAGNAKERRTIKAMDQDEPVIYSGRMSADNLLDVPDLLRKELSGYVAEDIQSVAGEAAQVSNRVAFTDHGTIIEEGPPHALFSTPRTRR